VDEPEIIDKVIDDAAAIWVDLTPTFVFIATWVDVSRWSGDPLVVIIIFCTGSLNHMQSMLPSPEQMTCSGENLHLEKIL
jgi:hypothetical protein